MPATAQVSCYSINESLSVSRNEVAPGGGSEKSFAIPGIQSSLIINGTVDLNIAPDIVNFARDNVTKNANFV